MSDNIIINENTPDQTSININGITTEQKLITVNTGSAVTTVNNRFGNVVLSSNDVGLSAVDNTSDLNKPISYATLYALSAIQNEINLLNSFDSVIESLSSFWNTAYTNLTSNSAAYLSAVNLSLINSTSGNWNTAYNIATVYQNISSVFATNTLLQNTSALLTPLNLTNNLTSQLLLNTIFNNYQTSVATTTATLLPTSVYQSTSGSFATNTSINSLTGNWNTAYYISTAYQNASGSFATNTLLQSTSALLTPITLTDILTSQLVLNTAINSLTGDWNSAYASTTALNLSSDNWNSTFTTLCANSSIWSVKDRLNNGTVQVILSSDNNLYFPTGTIGDTFQDGGFTIVGKPGSYAELASNDGNVFAWASDTNYSNPVGGGFSIGTDTTTLTGGYVWTFGNDGLLHFPDGSIQPTAFTNNLDSYATVNYVDNNFLNLSGGLVSGPVRINNNLTVFGNLTATGTTTFANTIFSTTSSLSVVHIGSGPALWVGNNGDGDIASFYDIDSNIEILHVGGNNGSFPNVGVKTSEPNVDFTVNGQISANNIIWDANGNSNNWNSAYASTTALNLSSNNWNSAYDISISYQNASGSFVTITLGDTLYSKLSSQAYILDSEIHSIQPINGSNTASANYSTVAGGCNNTVSGGYSTISGGYQNIITGAVSNIAGGNGNTISGVNSNIAGGGMNNVSGCYSNIAGGLNNTACGDYSNVAGGWCNTASGVYSNVAGGFCNTASGHSSNIVGGSYNIASGSNSHVANGDSNIASGNFSNVVGGIDNTASGYNSNVYGGSDNTACGDYSNVAGGCCNNVSGCYSSILGGCSNVITHNNSFVIGSGITSDADNTTYVNNLSSQGVIAAQGGNSNNWNNAYDISTTYQNDSGSFATNTLLQSTSALLTPLTLTRTLTSQLVLNTDINSLTGNWNSAYASTTALNLSSGNWNNAYDALDYVIVNSNFNAIANRKYIVDTTSSNVIGTLPSSPALGDNISFVDSSNTWSVRPLILNNNGNLLQTYNEPLTADISGYQFQLVYVGGLYGWKIV